MPQKNGASAEQTMTSVFVQPELSLMAGRRCTQSCSTYFPSPFVPFFIFHVRGEGVEPARPLALYLSSLPF